jgi:hypothetical protein
MIDEVVDLAVQIRESVTALDVALRKAAENPNESNVRNARNQDLVNTKLGRQAAAWPVRFAVRLGNPHDLTKASSRFWNAVADVAKVDTKGDRITSGEALEELGELRKESVAAEAQFLREAHRATGFELKE